MGRLGITASLIVLALMLSAVAARLPRKEAPVIQRVSVTSDGKQANGHNGQAVTPPSISEDGRFVAFSSNATNLVAGDTNGCMDVFVHDCLTGQTTRVSVASDGTQGDLLSYAPVISADGRHVAFRSYASNLVPNDTNKRHDVFVHHLATGETERVNVTSKGEQVTGDDMTMEVHEQLAISANGRYVAFATDAPELKSTDQGWGEVYVHDCQSGNTEPVAVNSRGRRANGVSLDPAISGDGRFVAFYSQATDLAPGAPGGEGGIFLHDRQSGETRCVNVGFDGKPADGRSAGASISQDGRLVGFKSGATNLVGPEVQGVLAQRAVLQHCLRTQAAYVHDWKSGQTIMASALDTAKPGLYSYGRPSLSGDGRYVAFASSPISQRADDVKRLGHVFLCDRTSGETVQVDLAKNGKPSNGSGVAASVSADGQHVAFCSGASNLVKGDTNGKYDVFVWSRKPPAQP